MEAIWHLIQYTSDMRRKEPRNIGVAVAVDGQWAIKLFGVDEAGGINGRALRRYGLSKDGYASWVDYYSDMILAGRWERVVETQQRRPAEFRLVPGGYIRALGTAADVAASLFAELVQREEQHGEPRAKILRQHVEATLELAEVHPQLDITVEASWGEDAADDVKFDYAYTNGQRHLMHRLQLHQTSSDASKMVAREFNARVTAARSAGAARSFIAFYSGEAIDEMGGDSMLTPVWKVAHIVDVDDTIKAAEALREIMHESA
ncbi:hypothetical protein [Nocardia sp. NBC_01327]|uniref:hypothetical protein n=1 Tax=Nocardia sp. NBC_01327 TaxID=2903593 RepID=UPI002E106332|nr:hypothetical protein OG326_14945 [Nocardia sp. NBC_01327]